MAFIGHCSILLFQQSFCILYFKIDSPLHNRMKICYNPIENRLKLELKIPKRWKFEPSTIKLCFLLFVFGMPFSYAQDAQDLFNQWRNSTQNASQNTRVIRFVQRNKLEIAGRQGRDLFESELQCVKRPDQIHVDRRPVWAKINGMPVMNMKDDPMMGKRYLMQLMRQIPIVFPGMFSEMSANALLGQENYNGVATYKLRLFVPEFGTPIQDVFVWLAKDDKRMVAAQIFLKPFQGENAATIRERFKMDIVYERQRGLDVPVRIQSRGVFKREQRNRVFHTEVRHEASHFNYEFR